MNADAPKLDDNDPIHEHAGQLVWLAQDLQGRLRVDPLPQFVHRRIIDIAELVGKIQVYLSAIEASAETPAIAEDGTDEAPPAAPSAAIMPSAQDLHPYSRAGGSSRGRAKGGGG